LERRRGISILERTMNRVAKYAERLWPTPAVGILLNDGRVISVPRGDLKRLLPKLASRA
jgi:hypothetical protein